MADQSYFVARPKLHHRHHRLAPQAHDDGLTYRRILDGRANDAQTPYP